MRKYQSLTDMPAGLNSDRYAGAPVVTVVPSNGRIEVEFVFPGFYYSEARTREIDGKTWAFRNVEVTSAGFLMQPGKPLLPSFGRYVQVPNSCCFSYSAEPHGETRFDGFIISPAQTHRVDGAGQVQEFKFEHAFYTGKECYPEEPVKVTGPFRIDDYKAFLIHVAPLRFDPQREQLIGYHKVKIIFEIGRDKQEKKSHQVDGPSSNGQPFVPGSREAFGNLLLNPGHKIEEKVGFPVPVKATGNAGPELLIIHADGFENAAKKLALWKQKRGIETKTICISEVGENADSIKRYIRNMKAQPFARLGYVLLLGDVECIPPEIVDSSLVRLNATDYYYSTQFDEKNPNPENPGCKLFMPWLSIGRIPVLPDRTHPEDVGVQAMSVVNQIIEYEQNPPDDPAYYKRMVFAAAFQDDNWPADRKDNESYLETVEYIRSSLLPLGYNGKRVYLTNLGSHERELYYKNGSRIPSEVRDEMIFRDDQACAVQALVDAVKEGQLLVCYRGHGMPDGWRSPRFYIDDLDKAVSDRYSIFYSISCWTGMFDDNSSKECFAEKNLRMKGAAPSLIAATRESNTALNDELAKALFDATFAGVLPTFPGTTASYPVRFSRLGDILNYAKSYLPVSAGADDEGVEYLKNHFEIYHVIGDPTLELWKRFPLKLKVKARIIQSVLDIQLSMCPSGCVLTIWSGDSMLKRIEPSSTHMTLPCPPENSLRVCCWAPGYRYIETPV